MSKSMSGSTKKILNKILDLLGESIFENLDELEKEIEACGGLKNACALAWNLEEKDVDVYTFKECVAWLKEHINKENARGAYIHKKELADKKYELNVFFFDSDKKALKGDNNSWLIVRCNSLDEDFIRSFGTRDVLVVQ